jgi:Protein of unknown function (DUF1499)
MLNLLMLGRFLIDRTIWSDRKTLCRQERQLLAPGPLAKMLYRPTVRTSRAARWSRRLAGIAVPIMAITLIGHRLDLIITLHALVLVGVSCVLGVVAAVLALFGLDEIWERGFRGAGDAGFGLIYAVIALSPALYGAYATATHPNINDISTDVVDPPMYREAAFIRAGRMNAVTPPDADKIRLQKLAYPDLATRRFGIGTDQLFNAAHKVAERDGWSVLDEVRPKEDGDRGIIEAVARTQFFGAKEDVVIRILAEPSGARIDVRSSSRYGTHDLGQNAYRIRSFFSELDAAVTESFGQ